MLPRAVKSLAETYLMMRHNVSQKEAEEMIDSLAPLLREHLPPTDATPGEIIDFGLRAVKQLDSE